jgi:RimJ/RimL family protein N-acetyltransferase
MCIIKTDRLHLRNLEPLDVDAIYDYRNNEVCNRYQRWEAFEKEDIALFIQRFQKDVFLSTKEEQHYAICLNEDGVLVGELAYFYTPGDCITLGISVSYNHHHKGYAFEMLQDVIKCIREKYPNMDIVGLIEKENCNSIKLFEKLGFLQECYAESIQSYVYVL